MTNAPQWIKEKKNGWRVMVTGHIVRTSHARIKKWKDIKIKDSFMVAVTNVSDDRYIREHYWFLWRPLRLIWQPCNLLCKFFKKNGERKIAEYCFII